MGIAPCLLYRHEIRLLAVRPHSAWAGTCSPPSPYNILGAPLQQRKQKPSERMDPYFRSAHGSNPSPHDESSPRSATSQYRPFPGTSGLDRLLQSPQDMMRYNKSLDRYSVPANKTDEVKGYDGYQYGQAQASGSQSQQPTGPAGTGKRGSKACVACKFSMSIWLIERSERQKSM